MNPKKLSTVSQGRVALSCLWSLVLCFESNLLVASGALSMACCSWFQSQREFMKLKAEAPAGTIAL